MACSIRRYPKVIIAFVAAMAAVLAWLLYRPPALYWVTVLPSLGGWRTQACSLNDSGQVVGVARRVNAEDRCWLWDRENGIQDLGPATQGWVMINNAG